MVIDIKYFAIMPPSSALSLIGKEGLYTWFADSTGQWIAGGSGSDPPTSAEFALVGATTGTPPGTAKFIASIPTSTVKDPFPPPPPALTAGTTYATYASQFSMKAARGFADPLRGATR